LGAKIYFIKKRESWVFIMLFVISAAALRADASPVWKLKVIDELAACAIVTANN
jgi:hypothetical protein